jgi:hypothetical protein
MKIVSQQSDEDIAFNRAKEDAEYKLRLFASNLLRVIAGAGKPEMVFQQMADAFNDWKAMQQIRPTGCQFEVDALACNPSLTRGVRNDGSPIDPADIARWHADYTFAVEDAEWDLQREALRVVASTLHGPTHLRSTAEGKFHDALRALADVRAKRAERNRIR